MGAHRFTRVELGGYFFLLLLSSALLYQLGSTREASLDGALKSFKERQLAESRSVSLNVETAFRRVYQGVRTIARLPAVRNLASESPLLHDDARVSAQEIYNNLAESLSVSELYIVPVDFDPNRVDPLTGKPEEPIMTFDQLIVGKHADWNDPLLIETELEETEIFEYREMRRQLDYLQAHYGMEDGVSALAYPAIVSGEVITCDNTRYSPLSPDDNDRKGILYSVPYYGAGGKLRGIVTAVVLSAVVGELLPSERYVLINNDTIFARRPLTAEPSSPALQTPGEGEAESAVYANLMPLHFPDLTGKWDLWTSEPSSEFLQSDEVRAVNARFWAAVATLLVGTSVLAVSLRWLSHRHLATEMRNNELSSRIADRTSELARATLAAEEANSAKSQFLARISHEIRTPMHAIMSATELLKPSLHGTKASGKLEMIQNASFALLELVNQVLDLTAIEHGKMEMNVSQFSPASLLYNTCDLLEQSAAEKGLAIRCLVNDDVPDSFCSDPSRIRQVLINLIGNAVKYTASGTITAVLSSTRRGSGEVEALVFDIIDEGLGIPEDQKETIFDPFRRGPGAALNPDGSGLGLAISRQLAGKLGGSLTVIGHSGPGAHFRFTVIAMENDPALVGDVAPESRPAGNGVGSNGNDHRFSARVLLAEDNPRMRELIRESLEALGCEVETSNNGVEAVLAIERSAFDIVLMDCSMPHLDGLEATLRIREWESAQAGGVGHAVPIVALTANVFSTDREACLAAGMNDFLSKPFTQAEISEVMHRSLWHSPRASDRTVSLQ